MISRMRKSIASGGNKAPAAAEGSNIGNNNRQHRRSRSGGSGLVAGASSGENGFGGRGNYDKEREENGDDDRKPRSKRRPNAQVQKNFPSERDPAASSHPGVALHSPEVFHGQGCTHEAASPVTSSSQHSSIPTPASSSKVDAPNLQRSKKAVASTPDTLMTFEKNRSTLKKLRQSSKNLGTSHGVNVTLPSLTIEQVMQLSVSPPGKSSELHHMINGRQWAAVRIKLKLLKSDPTKSSSAPRKLTSAGVAASAANLSSVTDVKPIKSSASMMKALLQRDELGRTPLHLILQRRSTGSSVKGTLSLKKAPPDIIVGILHACPRASSIPDTENNYTLHVAVLNGHRTDIVRLLVHCYPGAVLEANVNMDTPLVLAANFSIALKPIPNPNPEDRGETSPQIITPHDSPKAITASSQSTALNGEEARLAFATSPRWELVSLFLQHHPESAQLRNRHDMSVLEMALQRHAPASIIRTLLRADKGAASIQRRVNLTNSNRLRGATSSQAGGAGIGEANIVEDSEPLAYAGTNVIGSHIRNSGVGVMTPLTLAIVRNAGVDVLGLVALAFPSALHVRDQCGVGAIAKCWIDWYYEDSQEGRRTVRKEEHVKLLAILVQSGRTIVDPKLATLWKKLQTLLCIAHHPESIKNRDYIEERPDFTSSLKRGEKGKDSPQEQDLLQVESHEPLLDGAAAGESDDMHSLPVIPPYPYTFRPVHAAASQDCPLEILNLALVLHPNQCAQRNENGSTPLHLAAAAPLYVKHAFEPTLVPPIERLVRMEPGTAATTDSYGRLPLHVAIVSGKRWHEGIGALVMAEPRALNSPDPSSKGLYPACMAACRGGSASFVTPMMGYLARNRVDAHKWNSMSEREQENEIARVRTEEELKSLSTVFELLRSFPLVVSKTLREQRESISCLALTDGTAVRSLAFAASAPLGESMLEPITTTEESELDETETDTEVDDNVHQGVPSWGVDDAANILLFKEGLSASANAVKKRKKKKKKKEKSQEDDKGNQSSDCWTTEDEGLTPSDSEGTKTKTPPCSTAPNWGLLGKSDRDVNYEQHNTESLLDSEPPELLAEGVPDWNLRTAKDLEADKKFDEKDNKMSAKTGKRRSGRRHSSGNVEESKTKSEIGDVVEPPSSKLEHVEDGNLRSGSDKLKSKVTRQVSGILGKSKSKRRVGGEKSNSANILDLDSKAKAEYDDLLKAEAEEGERLERSQKAALSGFSTKPDRVGALVDADGTVVANLAQSHEQAWCTSTGLVDSSSYEGPAQGQVDLLAPSPGTSHCYAAEGGPDSNESTKKKPILSGPKWDLLGKSSSKTDKKAPGIYLSEASPKPVDAGVPDWNFLDVETDHLIATNSKSTKKAAESRDDSSADNGADVNVIPQIIAAEQDTWNVFEIPGKDVLNTHDSQNVQNNVMASLGDEDKDVFKGEPSWSAKDAAMEKGQMPALADPFADLFGRQDNGETGLENEQESPVVHDASPPKPIQLASSTRKRHDTFSTFKKGEDVLYRDSKGNITKVNIVKVHFDDELEPFYDIRFATGKEKQTDDSHLSKYEEKKAAVSKAVDPEVRDPIQSAPATAAGIIKNSNPFAWKGREMKDDAVDLDGNPFDAFGADDATVQPLDLFGDYEESAEDENPFDSLSPNSLHGSAKSDKAGLYENENLPQAMICVVCNERNRQTLLLPCRHLCVCSACGALAQQCPICGQLVQNVVDVIL
jgi:hypothetical protein